MSLTFLDTHAVVKRLLAAGFTDAQAEAVTLVVREAQDIDLSNLATKLDLAAMKTDLQAQLATTKADLEAQLANTKADLEKSLAETKVDILKTKVDILKWMIGAVGVQTIVILGAVIALVRMTAH